MLGPGLFGGRVDLSCSASPLALVHGAPSLISCRAWRIRSTKASASSLVMPSRPIWRQVGRVSCRTYYRTMAFLDIVSGMAETGGDSLRVATVLRRISRRIPRMGEMGNNSSRRGRPARYSNNVEYVTIAAPPVVKMPKANHSNQYIIEDL